MRLGLSTMSFPVSVLLFSLSDYDPHPLDKSDVWLEYHLCRNESSSFSYIFFHANRGCLSICCFSQPYTIERIYSTFIQVLEYMLALNFCNFSPNLKPSEGPPATADRCLEQQVVTLALTFNCCSSLCRKVATQQLLHSLPKGHSLPHSTNTHSAHSAKLYHPQGVDTLHATLYTLAMNTVKRFFMRNIAQRVRPLEL